MTVVNPLVPGAVDGVGVLITVAALGLAIGALGSHSRDRVASPGQVLLWALLIVLVPVLGPIAWLAGGRCATAAGQ